MRTFQLMDVASVKKWGSLAGIVAAGWTLVALFSAVRIGLDTMYAGQQPNWSGAIVRGAAQAYPWALSTPIVLWLARRFPLARRKLLVHAAVHGLAGISLSTINFGIYAIVLTTFDDRLAQQLTLLELQLNLLIYGALVGVAHAINFAQRFRARELKTSQLEAQLAGARLDLLKTQLHPHFLFNTLNAVAELVHEDALKAEQMIGDLSELLRQALDAGATDTVALEHELKLLEKYLAIQRTRFEDQLNVEVEVPEDVRGAMVPYLVLQPIVENAIKYSMKNRNGSGLVKIQAAVRGEELQLEVIDNGPGFALGDPHEGVGLANTRGRLRHRYGDKQSVDIGESPNGGAKVSLRIPFNTGGFSQ